MNNETAENILRILDEDRKGAKVFTEQQQEAARKVVEDHREPTPRKEAEERIRNALHVMRFNEEKNPGYIEEAKTAIKDAEALYVALGMRQTDAETQLVNRIIEDLKENEERERKYHEDIIRLM